MIAVKTMLGARPMMMKGHVLLKRWRKAKKLPSYAAAGRALGVPWNRYRRWELGEHAPLIEDMMMLRRRCGIPARAWW